eukprot:43742-Chlamydomonas_euryale.AAC.2
MAAPFAAAPPATTENDTKPFSCTSHAAASTARRCAAARPSRPHRAHAPSTPLQQEKAAFPAPPPPPPHFNAAHLQLRAQRDVAKLRGRRDRTERAYFRSRRRHELCLARQQTQRSGRLPTDDRCEVRRRAGRAQLLVEHAACGVWGRGLCGGVDTE